MKAADRPDVSQDGRGLGEELTIADIQRGDLAVRELALGLHLRERLAPHPHVLQRHARDRRAQADRFGFAGDVEVYEAHRARVCVGPSRRFERTCANAFVRNDATGWKMVKRCVHLRRDASPAAVPSRWGLACALFAACALASILAGGGSAPAFVASPSVPERLIGSSYATLRVQLSDTGFVYFLATPQDDAGALADATDDGPHVVIANVTTDERRAVPTPEEVRLGVLAFLNDTDSDPSNDSDNASSAFGRGALAAGTLNVTAADAVFSVNVTGLNPQSHNDLWVVAANASGLDAALQTHVALLAFRARTNGPPGFRDVTGEDDRGDVDARAARRRDRRERRRGAGRAGERLPRGAERERAGADVRAGQSESGGERKRHVFGLCRRRTSSAGVPVGCPVFNLSQATSYAAYFVVEGLGLTFVTHGEPPSPPRPSRGSSSPRTTPRRAAPPRLALLRATASSSPRRARKRLAVFRRRRGG